MQAIRNIIGDTQLKIKELRQILKDNNIDFDIFCNEMIECLVYIKGYTDKALQSDEDTE